MRTLALPDQWYLSKGAVELIGLKGLRVRSLDFRIRYGSSETHRQDVDGMVNGIVRSPHWRPGRDSLQIRIGVAPRGQSLNALKEVDDFYNCVDCFNAMAIWDGVAFYAHKVRLLA